MSDAPLRIAQAKAQLADANAPLTPLDLIPDAETRGRESTRQTFERIARYLGPEALGKLRAMGNVARSKVITRIVQAERQKERLAMEPPTPSPKQRRAKAAREASEAAKHPSGNSAPVHACTEPEEPSEDQQLTEESHP